MKQISSVNVSAKKSDKDAGVIVLLNQAVALMPERIGGYSATEALIEVFKFYIEAKGGGG